MCQLWIHFSIIRSDNGSCCECSEVSLYTLHSCQHLDVPYVSEKQILYVYSPTFFNQVKESPVYFPSRYMKSFLINYRFYVYFFFSIQASFSKYSFSLIPSRPGFFWFQCRNIVYCKRAVARPNIKQVVIKWHLRPHSLLTLLTQCSVRLVLQLP